ncbi:MAG: hypothetical protein EHM85_15595 [Desulfobacteraceae bacterium]|nr:MAG: hypothetical protein EHM85_15595 [Desulfobacteraceae bacterium]
MMKKNKAGASRNETLAAAAILSLLVITAALVFLKQFRYDPSIFPSGITLSDSSDKTLPAGDIKSSLSVVNMIPMSPLESFDEDNLSDKINGKAELYLSAGFKNLSCRRFKKEDDPGSWLEVFIYDMGNIENAFAVYSVQKREGFIPLQLSGYSYKTENALFFITGRHYVEITSSKVSAFLMDSMLSFSQDFIKMTGAGETVIPDTELFPAKNLDEGSIVLFPANAFSFDRLNMVFAADYKTDKGRVKAFLSRRKNNTEADELAESYSAFLSSLGGSKIKTDTGLGNIRIIEIMDAYELIFTNGPFFAGIHSADDLKDAEIIASALNIKLGENSGAR